MHDGRRSRRRVRRRRGGGHAASTPRSLAGDAWQDLRRSPLFLISAAIILVLIAMAVAPGLFTSSDPRDCDLALSRLPPSGSAWFGYDLQGCDMYARTIYGARASILVGVLTTVGIAIVGSVVGMLAGYHGGRVDALLSRVTDMFFAVPMLLGAIIVLATFPSDVHTPAWQTIGKVVLALGVLGWTTVARLMRSTVIQVKEADFVNAARGLGAGPRRILLRHIVPNAMAPVIVYSTIILGVFVVLEATLSFLGIGLQAPVISWGTAISEARTYVRQSPHMLLFPSVFLSVTVLAFIMLGDAVRDAFDPKLR
ncbi:ABC transporter permease [Jiangella mangrovi]|uniref:Oligopeptide transport system permease protein n=1 Tax=Jiangella mangrovi TaxID=1524084 RepID=A0A7W9GLF8_9ACTN|nr:ABC transporter permease [Jiangella mangrovi]MBB5785934.1 oligopeptide transport system permease protein [Jiangella mangrovi]